MTPWAFGLYPNFYALTQELSYKHRRKVTGILTATNWVAVAILQALVGEYIKATKSYAAAMVVAGVVPRLAVAAVWGLWRPRQRGD